MRFSADENEVLERGKGPILLEPVKATIAVAGRHMEKVNLLDHDGRRTDRTLSTTHGQFTIDGATDKTMYYEIVLR